MTESQFLALGAQGFSRVPLLLETLADLDTPLSLYLKLANAPYSFLLESVVGGERFGRYSFIGLPATTRIEARDHQLSVITPRGTVTHEVVDPLAFIAAYQAQFRIAPPKSLPRFVGGLCGYFAYETIRYIEPKLAAKPPKDDPIGVPDIMLLLTEELAIIDNLSGKVSLLVYADPTRPGSYGAAKARLKNLREQLQSAVRLPLQKPSTVTNAHSLMGEAAYLAAVQKCKDYIAAGDCMQVLPSQRMQMAFPESPLSLYRALRSLNPSPYMFYYDFADFHVVGASPEILVRKEADTVTVRPLAGTRKRGATLQEDQALASELLSDAKEIAEHVMLIDLGRNDVGRVAEKGTVKVIDKMAIEKYSHVMHIVSHVEAKLKAGLNNMEVLKATFPAGTLSGAPKIRAMEIIDEIETLKRGIYGGAVGYLSYQGDMDLAIAIRTAVIKDGTLYAQAAAGVVHDSVPESEWQETLAKARAILRAAEMVQQGLDGEV